MPQPIFLGRPILTAANPVSDEVGGSLALSNGNLLAYWQQDRLDGSNFVPEGFKLRVIDSLTHKPAAAITLDIGPANAVPEVVALANGNFVVSWESRYVSGVGNDVLFRVFDAQGAPVTAIQQADPRPAGSGSAHALDITALSNGGFVAAWEQYRNGSYECYAQTYDATGAAAGTEVRLNAFVKGGQNAPEIQALTGGRFLAVWSDQGGAYAKVDGTSQVARLFQADGTAISAAFRVNQSINGGHDTSRIVAVTELSGGGLALVWRHSVDAADGSGTVESLVTRMFSSTGVATSNEMVIATAAAQLVASPSDPSVTALLDGRFMVAWSEYTYQADPFGQFSHVLARVINADGTPAGAAFTLDEPTAERASSPVISTLLDGRVAVSYTVQSGPLGRPDLLTQILDPRLAAIDLHGSDGNDRLLGTMFNDSIAGGLCADRLNGGAGNDRIFGEGGNDVLSGGNGNDQVFGGSGQDTLLGGNGRDTLIGGAGNDELTGGADGDSFVFQAGQSVDEITDFDINQDTLNLRNLHFADADAALAAFSQTADGAMFAQGGLTVLLAGVDLAALDASLLLI